MAQTEMLQARINVDRAEQTEDKKNALLIQSLLLTASNSRTAYTLNITLMVDYKSNQHILC